MLVTIDGITYLVNRGTKEYDHLQMVITARRNGWHWVKVELNNNERRTKCVKATW